MISIAPEEISQREVYTYLTGTVGPRPIAFASTINAQGVPNLAPFSFFNVFSANPPILVFSPALKGSDGSKKHTLENVLQTREVVINLVDYAMVQQMSLASAAYPEGANEFVKAGLQMLKSDVVAPYRVAEAPVQFECKVTKVEALGEEGGAGNLVFSEVIKIHIAESLLDENGKVDQHKIDLVARMGDNWYTRSNRGMFEVAKPLTTLGIGVDQIPEHIRNSKVLTGNNLGMLGNVEQMPSSEEVANFVSGNTDVKELLKTNSQEKLEQKAQEYLKNNEVLSAWKVLLANI
ncbi:flavin reductase family protein [Spongiimicrobium salis]|uniref:flavin reductase family protein n=1 Tax=Spongiimicrobium salis TaxID=1667022 RepID=UPI00374D135E